MATTATDEPTRRRSGDAAADSEADAVATPPSAPPITNAILSQAVLSAISQMDTKLAFDMLLLSEQMNVMCVRWIGGVVQAPDILSLGLTEQSVLSSDLTAATPLSLGTMKTSA